MIRNLLFATVVLMIVSGCASTSTEGLFGANAKDASNHTKGSLAEQKTESLTVSTEGQGGPTASSDVMMYRGMKIGNATFDLPVEMNRSVEKWIDYFTGRGRERFEAYLKRSEYFVPFLRPILKNAKAPEDLVYLAMIESGFNNNARSHARAVGAWQFISATGRRYGLDVNWWVDERRDVEKSTIAAVQYLKELNAMFGSWHLAAAGYNAGEAKIQRAIKKYKTNDFWELCKFRYLRPETKNYVPKLFAAAIISKNRKQFGFEENYAKIAPKTINAAVIAEKAEENEPLQRLPDQLEGDKAEKKDEAGATPTDPMVEVTKDTPPDAEEEAITEKDDVEEMLRGMSNTVRTPHVNLKGEVNGDVLTEVEIPSPADLFKVSSCAGLTYMEFKSMNPELSRWLTPPDRKAYKIRLPLSRKESFIKKYFEPTYNREVNFLTYKARKGDTPRRIAKRFGISADPVVEMNKVSTPASSFVPGTMVQLPIPSDFVRSLASLKSLDLIDPSYPKRMRYRRGRRSRRSHRSVLMDIVHPQSERL